MSNSVQCVVRGTYLIRHEYGAELCELVFTNKLIEILGDEGADELATHVYLAVERALQQAKEETRRERIKHG